MHKRQERIILFLDESKSWMTGKELAQLLNVSDRTIRTDIESINKEFNKLIESNIRYGYRINQIVFTDKDIKIEKMIPQTSNERCIYILHELLFNKNEINLTFLQEEVYVSGYSIDNDIKKIKSILKPYPGLNIERKKNYISLVGSEENKRTLYKDLLSSETKGNFINLDTIAQLYHDINLLEIKDIIESTLDEYNFKVKEDTFPMLMIHIGVAIERIKGQHFIVTDYKTKELQNSKEYEIASNFFEKVSKKYCLETNEDEVALIALLLLGKKSAIYTEEVSKVKSNVDISNLMDQVFVSIKSNFDIDFTKDNSFKVGLRLHLQNLIERIQKQIPVNNLYLLDIKKKYPLVFEMAIFVSHEIEKETNLNINEDEIGYLALHLGAAYDRLNVSEKYDVLLIHPNNQFLASMCIKKIDERFSERMVIVDVLNYFETTLVEEYNPDLIISTVPLKHKLSIPTITVSLFINSDDEFKIFQALNELDKKRNKKIFEETIQELIVEDLFFSDLDCKTPEEVITFMCNKMLIKDVVDEEFKNSVLERESIAATSFNYGFAVPHSLKSSKKTTISIATLKNEINWGQYEVRLIILLAVNDDNRKILSVFFDWLSNLTNNSSKLVSLLETKTCDEFIDHILQ